MSSSSGAGRRPEQVRLPQFFLVGPPRTGTSWLHCVLSGQAALPQTKETRFFDLHFHRGLSWYLAHYSHSHPDRVMGEVAPTYFASAEARDRMAATVPNAKIVCIFRDPVERVVSLYRLKRAYGMIPWPIEQAIVRDPELMESGLYATKLKGWYSSFGSDQVLAMVYDDLRTQPQKFVNHLASFIGLPAFPLTAAQADHIHSSESMSEPRNYLRTRSATIMADWFKARRLHRIVAAVKTSPAIKLFLGGGPPFAEVSREFLLHLYELFRPEVEELEALLNRDFSAWKSGQPCIESIAV